MAVSSEEMNIINKIFLAIENKIESKLKNVSFDITTRGKVISISSDYKSAVVMINNANKTCYCHPLVGKNISVGDIVSVCYESGNRDTPRIRL